MTRFQKLAVATTSTTLVLIVWGGIVRATGSGDGCPDWPTCFGSWIPRWEYHTLIEYVHRLLGVTSGLLAVALAATGLVEFVRAQRGRPGVTPRSAVWLAVALVPLFAVQGALGGAVVNRDLDPEVGDPALRARHGRARRARGGDDPLVRGRPARRRPELCDVRRP